MQKDKNRQKMPRTVLLSVCLLVVVIHTIYKPDVIQTLAAQTSSTNLIQNGNFQQGVNPNRTLSAGSTDIADWIVLAENVDWIDGTAFGVTGSDSPLFIDLNGCCTDPGGISQTFSTVPSQEYVVRFDLNANLDNNILQNKTVRVSAAGQQQDFVYVPDFVGATPWRPFEFHFTAQDASTTLAFQSLVPNSANGPLLDNVWVCVAISDYITLRNFGLEGSDGNNPVAGLIKGIDGNFYGTTLAGGDESINCCGTVFKITPDGTYTVLYTNNTSEIRSNLFQDSDGTLYGTVSQGGPLGNGFIFKISPEGVFSTLYNFNGSDGATLLAGVIKGIDGDFYGTAFDGGEFAGVGVFGTIYKITPEGSFTLLHSFNGSDGTGPSGSLIQGNDGWFYGTTFRGGDNDNGTIFKISPTGAFVLLYSFGGDENTFNGLDGGYPTSSLVIGNDGFFYGTVDRGGANGLGGIFKISSTGAFTLLHSFSEGDGSTPTAGLILGSDGNFYGTTYHGGENSQGTIFKFSPTGSLTLLHSFGDDGSNPSATGSNLAEGDDGFVYGTTSFNGTLEYGTIFKFRIFNTLTGNNVTVSPESGTTVTFSSVSSPGNTTATTSSTGPQPPAGFQLGALPIYYNISTTASFTPPITIALTYDPTQFTDPNNLRLLHFENNDWIDITTNNDTVNNIISGQSNSLSPFIVAEMTTNQTSVDFYLHASGSTLLLNSIAPTGTTAKFKDSASLQFSGGNPWKEVGTWAAAPMNSSQTLTALSDLHAWLGLKNSDDQGTRFDLRAEVYKNGTLIGSGETFCITDVTRNPNLAKEVIVSFGSISNGVVAASDVLSLKVLTRIGTNGAGGFCGGHSNAVGLRLYFDSVSRPAKFKATF